MTLLTPEQAAARYEVEQWRLANWARRGLLPAQRTMGGHRRYRDEDVKELAMFPPTPRRRRPSYPVKEMERLYESGLSLTQVGEELGCHPATVCRAMQRARASTRTISEAQLLRWEQR